MVDWNGQDRCRAVALFPLPSVVLFPRAVLPLHIFEERYRAMTADSLRGNRLIAMALLKAGWEKDYYSRPAIEPVVCVGRILTHEQLPDGKYNLLLQGIGRAKIAREIPNTKVLYRTADLDPLVESQVLEIDLCDQRQKLGELFEARLRQAPGLFRQFRQMLTSPLPTADVADLVAFNLFEDVRLKQLLLEETEIVKRVDRVIAELSNLEFAESSNAAVARVDNPSLN
jgi:Lon protease-like protein